MGKNIGKKTLEKLKQYYFLKNGTNAKSGSRKIKKPGTKPPSDQ